MHIAAQILVALVCLIHVYIFLLETVALEAFGISWLVKGETLWKDTGK